MTDLEVYKIMNIAIKTDVGFNSWTVSTPHLRIFAEMIAKQEREACALVADDWSGHYQASEIAKAIRERNND